MRYQEVAFSGQRKSCKPWKARHWLKAKGQSKNSSRFAKCCQRFCFAPENKKAWLLSGQTKPFAIPIVVQIYCLQVRGGIGCSCNN